MYDGRFLQSTLTTKYDWAALDFMTMYQEDEIQNEGEDSLPAPVCGVTLQEHLNGLSL